MIAGDDEDPENPHALNINDVLDYLKPISTVNNTHKYWKAIQTGKWISGNETVMGEIGANEALASAITGLELEDMTDNYLRMESGADLKSIIKNDQRTVQKEFARARRALDKGDFDAYNMHVKRGRAAGIGLSTRQMKQAVDRGFSPETLTDSTRNYMDTYYRDYWKRKEAGE